MQGMSKDFCDARYEKFEEKRQEFLSIVKRARARIMDQMIFLDEENRRGGSVREASHFTTTKSRMHIESLISDTQREDYDRTIQRAKQREINLMNKMLKNEALKNKKLEQDERQRKESEKRMTILEQRKQQRIKEKQEEAMRKEMERIRNQRFEEKKKREEAFERLQREREQRRLEEERKLRQDKKKQEVVKEREMVRKAKVERSERQKAELTKKQAEKLKVLEKKARERDEALRRSQELERKRSLERKREMEAVREKVQRNVRMEEQKLLEDYWTRQNEQEKRESKLRKERMKQMEALKKQSIESNEKIKKTVEESKKREEQKKKRLLDKNKESEQRLELLRTKKAEEDRKQRELILINNELKKVNMDRRRRKDQYKIEKLKEKFEFDDMRRTAYANEKEEYKTLRVRNQVEAQGQRQLVRTALRSMAVWNVWDMDIINEILTNPKCTEEATIDEIVRRRASVAQDGRRNNSSTLARNTSQANMTVRTSRPDKGNLTTHDEGDAGATYYVSSNRPKARSGREEGDGNLAMAVADDYVNQSEEEVNKNRQEQAKEDDAKEYANERFEDNDGEQVVGENKEGQKNNEKSNADGGKKEVKEEHDDEFDRKGLALAAVDDYLEDEH